MNERTYIAIDLKSFYASVECVERDLDPSPLVFTSSTFCTTSNKRALPGISGTEVLWDSGKSPLV